MSSQSPSTPKLIPPSPGLEPSDESVVAVFETDLDENLRYRDGSVELTPSRIRIRRGADVVEHPLAQLTDVRFEADAGLGRLDFVGPDGPVAGVRFTAGKSPAAERFVKQVRGALLRSRGQLEDETAGAKTVCPTCGSEMPAGAGECPVCAVAPPPPPARSLFRLLRFARPRAAVITLGFLLTLAGTSAGLVAPYLTMPLLDRVLIPRQNGVPVDFSLVAKLLAGLAGAAVLEWMLAWLRTYVMAHVSERISSDVRNTTYAHLQRLSLEFFGGKRTGDLISRVGSDSDRICNFLSVNLLDFANDVLMILLTAGILLSIDPELAAVTLIPFPALAWLTQKVRVRLREGFDRASRVWGDMVSVLADTIPGIRVVKAFAQESREIERFARADRHVIDANDRVNRTWSFFGPMVGLLTQSGLLVIWWAGSLRVAEGAITVGVLTAFLAYIARFYVRLESMTRILGAVQRAAAASHRIFEILDRSPAVAEPAHPVAPGRLQGRIELRNVSFRYGTRTVLHGLNLTIEPGELIGLVGHSGAGKSTLVNLVCRFFDPAEGAVLVDGTDIRRYPIEDFRRNLAVVLQEPFLFYGTVAENLAYGKPGATRGEIVSAARSARAHEFVLRLREGYDSMVGERGQSLSGGERQRISIARALLTDPRILILDEATSSVDTETERRIQEALETLVKGRTTIAIAHRLSTLRRADRLVVLDQGRIVEVGRHDELLAADGAYARFHRAQQEAAGTP